MIDLDAFNRDGFVILRGPEVTRLKADISSALANRALAALEKEVLFEASLPSLQSRSFPEIVDHVVAHETANAVSGRLYRIFAATPEFIAAIADRTILNWVSALGVNTPVAGTLPILRIDRPKDEWHRTPAHQDWWFSLCSPNCVTVWFGIGPITQDMGLLEVVPGSHRAGLIRFKRHDNNNPFRPIEDWPEEAFRPVDVAEDGVLIFSQFLLHRSGFNRSWQTRLSVQLRYNDLMTMQGLENSFTVKHSAHVLDEQARLLGENQ